MRFGVFDHNDASGRPATQQLAERLALVEEYERLGYYAYHMAEHHGTPLGITPSPHLMLAAASQRTSVIRLGTLISILPLYHPMRVIEEACTLDQLTGGRLDLGVGRGISPIETGFHGVPGEETQERFDEAFAVLRIGPVRRGLRRLPREVLRHHERAGGDPAGAGPGAAVVRDADAGEGTLVRAARHADDGAGAVAGRAAADRRVPGGVGVAGPRGGRRAAARDYQVRRRRADRTRRR